VESSALWPPSRRTSTAAPRLVCITSHTPRSVAARTVAMGCVPPQRLSPPSHLLILLGPLLEKFFDADAVAFALGGVPGSVLSDMCGLLTCWVVFLAAVFSFYRFIAPLVAIWAKRAYPDAPTGVALPPAAYTRLMRRSGCIA